MPSKSRWWREAKNTEVFNKATVPRVGAAVASAIAMAIVAVVVIALLEPKAAGHGLNVRSSCAFGASDEHAPLLNGSGASQREGVAVSEVAPSFWAAKVTAAASAMPSFLRFSAMCGCIDI